MILLLFVFGLVAQFFPSHAKDQIFILRSQLDPNIVEALDITEKKITTELLNDKRDHKFSSLNMMKLKPLYFHVDDLAVQVSDMYLTSSDFTLEETKVDVLGHRMMPVAKFKWAEINGKLKIGPNTNEPEKFEFRLVQNMLKGKGVVSLTVDLTNVIWSYIFFTPNDSNIELKDPKEVVDSNVFKVINSSEFGDLLAMKLQRDISHHLTTIVSKSINETMKKTSKFKTLQPYSEEISEIGINNTENANIFIDSILKVGGTLIREKFGDQIRIPDIKEEFSTKFLVTFRGSFRALQGAARGTSSVYRIGDVVFGYDKESLLHFYGTLGFRALNLHYNNYKAEMWGVGPSGSLDTTLSPLSVLVHVHLNTSSKTIVMEKFKISNVGDLDVSLTGLGGMFNWLVSRVTTWVVGMYRDEVLHQLESQYDKYAREIFATYSIEELLNDGKNEAYVL